MDGTPVKDVINLPNNLLSYLDTVEAWSTSTAYRKACRQLLTNPFGQGSLQEMLYSQGQKGLDTYCLSRLVLLPEPAGKVRTIGIVDYWTQRALYPLHRWMLGVLSCLPADCTFDQEGGIASLVRSMRVFGLNKA
jgi:hypothetical protein